jgi:very-short-patch-repair endonuclease
MDAERRAARLAEQHDGVIHLDQLRHCGLSERQVRWRLKRGRLIRIHHKVFLVAGAALTFRARVRAALLALGPTAFASHMTAAVLWGIRRGEPDVIDVTVLGGGERKLAGVRVHRLRRAPDGELRNRHGLRISAPARTICELAATEPRETVEYAIQEAAARGLLTPRELAAAADRWGARRGAVVLRAILQVESGGDFTRSWAERRLRAITDRAGLPRAEKNVHVLGHRCDAVWPAQRLIVEVDGIGTHGTPVAFAADRAMDAQLTLAGWRVLRFTARQLKDQPMLVAVQIAVALSMSAA